MQIQCYYELCTAVDSMRRKPCVRNCSRKREGLLNGNVQQNPLCAASCVTKDIHISPRFSPAFFYRDANSVLLLAHLCISSTIFDPDANSVHLRAHLCTAVDSTYEVASTTVYSIIFQPTCTSCTTEEYTGNNGIFPYLRAGEPAAPLQPSLRPPLQQRSRL